MSIMPNSSEFGGDTEIEVFTDRRVEIVSASGYENIVFESREAINDFIAALRRAENAAFPGYEGYN